MKILGIDTSAKAVSAAFCDVESGRILAHATICNNLTHSQTMLPMMEGMLHSAALDWSDADCFAVSTGPGSFTGLRIGICAVKGLAYALNRPCIAVSTLLGLAYNLRGLDGLVCPVMDARCQQVYTALFRIRGDNVERLSLDEALPLSLLAEKLSALQERVTLVGDGAELAKAGMALDRIVLAPPQLRIQSGVSVCFAALGLPHVSASELAPSYLRLPQAERELLARQQANK